MRYLPEIGRFAAHVRAGEDHNRIIGGEIGIVRRKRRAFRQARRRLLHHRMAPAFYVNDQVVRQSRANVAVRFCHLGQRGGRVEFGDGVRRGEQARRRGRDLAEQLPVELAFQLQDALLGVEHQRLVFLQLGRDVALGVDQRLFADVVGRDECHVRLRDLDVVAEDLVVADLQRFDAGARPLDRFQIGDPAPGVARRQMDAVELGREAGPDDAGCGERGRRVVGDGG